MYFQKEHDDDIWGIHLCMIHPWMISSSFNNVMIIQCEYDHPMFTGIFEHLWFTNENWGTRMFQSQSHAFEFTLSDYLYGARRVFEWQPAKKPSGYLTVRHGKSLFLIGKFLFLWAISHGYVK